MRPARAGILAGLSLLSGVAWAHSPFKGLDNFYAGLLHPLFVPAHLLAIVVLGVLYGQGRSDATQLGALAFLAGLMVGLLVTLGWPLAGVEVALLASAALTGVSVALDARWPRPLYGLLGFGLGLLVGLDSAQPQLAGRGLLAALLGSVIAAYLLLLYSLVVAELIGRRPRLRIVLRVLGSWIAASAVMVLALALAG